MLQRYAAATCPMKLNLLNFHGTCRGNKITPKLVLHNSKSISSQEGTCRWNISPKHVHATPPCVRTRCDIVPATCPRYMSPQCAPHKFLVAARRPCRRPLVSAHLKSATPSPPKTQSFGDHLESVFPCFVLGTYTCVVIIGHIR